MTLKDNWHEFMAVLDNHGITKLYHFTDRDNLESIINNGGLYSWADCENKGIDIAKPGGDSQSRSLDSRDGLQNYVRVCFTRQHPMMFVAMNDGRISDPVILEIDPEVVYWKGTKYADRNATRTGARIGSDVNALKRIHFNSVKATKHFDLDVDEQPFFQAEILVPNCIPLEYITNISNFGISIPSPSQNAKISDFKIGQHLSTEVTDEDIRNGVKDEFGAIYSPDGKRLLKGPNIKLYSIREGTIVVCDDAFNRNESLVQIIIPNSVTKIGSCAFFRCENMVSVSLSNSLEEITFMSFSNCKSLTSIKIPFGITKIGSNAFEFCESLVSISIPKSVKEICSVAFAGCHSLSRVDISDLKSWCHTIFQDNPLEYARHLYLNGQEIKRLIVPNNVVVISRCAFIGCDAFTSISIPDSVKEIGKRAFDGCGGIVSINICPHNPKYDSRNNCNAIIETSTNKLITGCQNTIIPDSITEIGEYAFAGCENMKTIRIPKSVKRIGKNAFWGCIELQKVYIEDLYTWASYDFETDYEGSYNNPLCDAHHLYLNNIEIIDLEIPNSIKKIGNSAFEGCESVLSISIPNSVEEIGEGSFSGCKGLTSLTIPDSVKIIGNFAFYSCSGLKSVSIPHSVAVLGSFAFEYCNKIETLIINNDKFASIDSFVASKERLKTVILGPVVTKIDNYAFKGCKELASITIPDSVTEIGKEAFEGCSNLTSLSVSNHIVKIGDNAFYGCHNLKMLNITNLEAWCNINFEYFKSNPLHYTHALYLNGKEITELTIPNSITKILDRTFYGFRSLTKLILHNSIEEIGGWAFYGCSGLHSITFPNSLKEIGTCAFSCCSSLTSISFSNIIEKLGSRTFKGCSNLTTIMIPNSLKQIGERCFSDCSKLSTIEVCESNRYYDSRDNCNAIIVSSTNTLIRGCTNTIIPDSIIRIGQYAFEGCSNLTSVTIPNSIEVIGDNAFRRCHELTSIHIPNSILRIGRNVFFECNKLSTIYIPKGSIKQFKRLLPVKLHNKLLEQ